MNQIRLSFLLPILAFSVLALVSAIALYSTLSGNRDPTQLPSVLVDKPAPKTTLSRLEQTNPAAKRNLTLANFYGQPLVVNFFASWCVPCRAEAPALETLSKQIIIIGIAYKDRSEDVNDFLTKFGNPFQAIGMDKDGSMAIEWGVYGVPETYLLDANGVVKLRHAGPLTQNIIKNDIMPAFRALGS